MSSKQSATTIISTLRRKCSGRRTTPSSRKSHRLCKSQKSLKNHQTKMGVSEKLEALKNLIPVKNEDMKADQLFEETADYIVFLKTQVEVLQRLIDLYGSNNNGNENNNKAV